ncbi:MAG: CapA family protein [Bacteroidales bacterium]|nr:CapA family protein [Bacteroidales bacterium]
MKIIADNKILLVFLLILTLFTACDSQVEIILTGDVLLDRGLRPMVEKFGTEYIFKDVSKVFKEADFVLINLEGPITDTVSPVNKKYIFRFDSKTAEGLKKSGVTHCLLANNHTVDQGCSGLRNTIKNLEKAGLKYSGIGYNKEQRLKPMILEKNGIEIAVFNCCLLKIENWISNDNNLNITAEDFTFLEAAVQNFKSKNPKTHILCVLHWGYEFRDKPEFFQRIQAQRLISAGADIIIGHHPHVVQTTELINSKLVVYSLGNFVFDQKNPKGRKAQIAKLNFSKDSIKYELIDIDIQRNCPKIKN